jgi:hypothetical protein
MTDPTPTSDPAAARRLLRNAYLELAVCGITWLITLTWTVGYTYLAGYKHAADSWLVRAGWARSPDAPRATVVGFPDWVFWGIVVPWVLATVFTAIYSLRWMPDDNLGQEAEAHHDV